jgi:maltooligosyltrehalose synthase
MVCQTAQQATLNLTSAGITPWWRAAVSHRRAGFWARHFDISATDPNSTGRAAAPINEGSQHR